MEIKVLVSQSADFTLGQLKKITPGGQFSLFVVEEYWPTGRTLKPGAKVPKEKKVMQYVYEISAVDNTTTGLLKTVHAKLQKATGSNSPLGRVAKISATKFSQLLANTKPTKTENKGSMGIRLSSSTASPAAKARISEANEIADLDKQIAALQVKRNALKVKLDKLEAKELAAQNKVKEDKLAASGTYFIVRYSKSKGNSAVEVIKTSLKAARSIVPSLTGIGQIRAVPNGKKSSIETVMNHTSRDPVTGKTIKGKAWFFVSKEMQKKYG